MNDNKICSIEVISWLKKQYVDKLNPEIVSVQMCQDAKDVWITVVKKIETEMGIALQKECINLGFIKGVAKMDTGWKEEGCTFKPERDLIDNAREFFMDQDTLMNTTPLFD